MRLCEIVLHTSGFGHEIKNAFNFSDPLLLHFLQMKVIVQKLDEFIELRNRVEMCEERGVQNSKQLKVLNKRFNTELSKYHYKQEEKIPYVFDAPDKNQYFSGRTREIDELERMLKLDGAEQENKVGIAAVCGLGGIGKTSLVTEYAHKMKNYYRGGVHWFSAEDDTYFERSVYETALKLGALCGNFDLTLTSTLMKIGQICEPCLVVLDCLDQLILSPYVLKFLSTISRHKVAVAVVILTRRNENLLVEEITSLQKSRCLNLKCLEVEEAKQFLFNRIGLARDENTNSVAENLVEELGGLPLALEQAGACIKVLHCNMSEYVEEYKIKRLELLNSQKAKPASLSQSTERLAVHTTWSLNISHIKENPKGMFAIRLMNAFAFLNPAEIEEELVNVGESPIEDEAFRDCLNSRIGCRQLINLLTNFSLFIHVNAQSVSTHRLVQELVRESLDPEEKVRSFVDAVRLLSFAFSRCSSPRSLLGSVSVEERLKTFDFPRNASSYYLWSRLCFHGFYLQQKLEKFLENPDPTCLSSLFNIEVAKIFHECVINLSANQKSEEAKNLMNLAYRILDWVPLSKYDAVEKILSNNSVSRFVVPLPKKFQIAIKQCSIPPISSVEPLDEKAKVLDDLRELEQKVENLKQQGNQRFKDGLYKEAVDAYSAAKDMSMGTPAFNPLLLTNRASAYIKLNQKDAALRDANEYILRFQDCWKGYARKALALDEKFSSEIAAALAYYHYLHQNDGKCIFSEYGPFKATFQGLKERIFICDDGLQFKLLMHGKPFFTLHDCLKIIVLGSKEYILDLSGHVSSASSDGMVLPIVIRNCILVGSMSDCSVNVKLKGCTSFELVDKCMLANLSVTIDKGQIKSSPKSWVKILNCSFSCNSAILAAVVAKGIMNTERCTFTNSKAGGLLCGGPGNLVVDDCTFARNGKAGLEVRENGRLTVRRSRLYSNDVDGLMIGPAAAECNVFDCEIYYNAREGIAAIDASKNIKLIRNNIFGNDSNGIYVRNSDADIRENKFVDNESWGIWSETNSSCNISMNDVARNKRGGVRVGKRLARKQFPSSLVELNRIYENNGPGYIDSINEFEDYRLFFRHIDVRKLETCADYKFATFQQNSVYNNEERIVANQSKLSSSWCSACFRESGVLKPCGKCFTASYCNADCQKRHWSKHKKLCKVLREKASYLITSMKRHGYDGFVNLHAKTLDEIGPNYSSPPPRDGKRFIVKLQADFLSIGLGELYMLRIYDRSLDVDEIFQDEFITHIVNEFGVLCEKKYFEKKLFLYCVFENGKLRLFINDFAPFQTW